MTRPTRSTRQSSRSPNQNRWAYYAVNPLRQPDGHDNLGAEQQALLAAADAALALISPAFTRREPNGRVLLPREDFDGFSSPLVPTTPTSPAVRRRHEDLFIPISPEARAAAQEVVGERASAFRRSRSATPSRRRALAGSTRATSSTRQPGPLPNLVEGFFNGNNGNNNADANNLLEVIDLVSTPSSATAASGRPRRSSSVSYRPTNFPAYDPDPNVLGPWGGDFVGYDEPVDHEAFDEPLNDEAVADLAEQIRAAAAAALRHTPPSPVNRPNEHSRRAPPQQNDSRAALRNQYNDARAQRNADIPHPSRPERARALSVVAGGEPSPGYSHYGGLDNAPRSPVGDAAVARRLDGITERLERLQRFVHVFVQLRTDRIEAQLEVITDALVANQRNGAAAASSGRKRKRSVVDLTGDTPSPKSPKKKVDFVDLGSESSSSDSSSFAPSSDEHDVSDDDDDDTPDTPSKKPKPSPKRSPSSPRTPPNHHTPNPPRTPRKAPPKRPSPRTPPNQLAPVPRKTRAASRSPARTPPQQTAPAVPATPPSAPRKNRSRSREPTTSPSRAPRTPPAPLRRSSRVVKPKQQVVRGPSRPRTRGQGGPRVPRPDKRVYSCPRP